MKTAFITGISGQNGSYLAEFLLNKNYSVWGSTRSLEDCDTSHLQRLGILEQVTLLEMIPSDYDAVERIIYKVQPDEVYNFAGQSSVGFSFEYPVETFSSIAIDSLILLDVIRKGSAKTRVLNAGSGECFGHTEGAGATETSPFNPQSPYAVAKAAAFWNFKQHRSNYGLFCCTALLFNHESPFRNDKFVTKKIVQAAYRIANGSSELLELGDLSVQRDWGWAPDYVDAMWRILQCDSADDFVVATGTSQSLESFVNAVFEAASLDWHKYVKTTESLYRPGEAQESKGNPAKASLLLGWKPEAVGTCVATKLYHEYASWEGMAT